MPGLDEAMVEKLNAAGIETVERMVSATATELGEVLGISEGAAEALRQDAEAATMAAGGAVGSGTTEAAQQEGIEPPTAPTSTLVAPPPEPQATHAEPVETPPAKTGRPRRWLARMETRRTRGWTRSVTAERRRSRPTRAGTRQGRRRTTRNLRRVTS